MRYETLPVKRGDEGQSSTGRRLTFDYVGRHLQEGREVRFSDTTPEDITVKLNEEGLYLTAVWGLDVFFCFAHPKRDDR